MVLHYTAMTSAFAAADWLCHPDSGVSAHYVLGADGTLRQLVAEADRAWHAGAGAWGDVSDVNSRSIGIELDNDGVSAFPDRQITALIDLLRGICARWRIPPARVIGHSDLAPGRKIDPGPLFPWDRLGAEGLAVRPEPGEEGDLIADLRAAGYTAEVDEETLLAAFRLRHRPGATGPADATDRALARALARAHPVDGRTRLA